MYPPVIAGTGQGKVSVWLRCDGMYGCRVGGACDSRECVEGVCRGDAQRLHMREDAYYIMAIIGY